MASTASNGNIPSATVVPDAPNARGGRSRGGRGRGRGGDGLAHTDREPNRGGRRGRGGGRGRGDRDRGTDNHSTAMNASDLTAKLSQVAASKAPAVQPPGEGEAEDDDQEVCFLCASDISFRALPPCNHWTCHVCALRMRALMQNKACSYCKVSDLPSPGSI